MNKKEMEQYAVNKVRHEILRCCIKTILSDLREPPQEEELNRLAQSCLGFDLFSEQAHENEKELDEYSKQLVEKARMLVAKELKVLQVLSRAFVPSQQLLGGQKRTSSKQRRHQPGKLRGGSDIR